MPQKLRQILWALGLILTVLGLALAITMNKLGSDNLMFMLPPSLGVVIIVCLLVSGLIQDVVSEIMNQVNSEKAHSDPAPPPDEGAGETATKQSNLAD